MINVHKLAGAMLALLLLSPFGPAHADCLEACLADSNCASAPAGDMNCVSSRKTCTADCRIDGAMHGAVAYDKTDGGWGISGNFTEQQSANKDALKFCAEHSSNCKIVAAVTNTCVAVSQGSKSTLTWSKESTMEKARGAAQMDCIEKSGDACDIKLVKCYLP